MTRNRAGAIAGPLLKKMLQDVLWLARKGVQHKRKGNAMTALQVLEIVIATGMLALMACMAWACLGFSKQR